MSRRPSPSINLALAASALALVAASSEPLRAGPGAEAAAAGARTENVTVALDLATIVKTPPGAATVVVGNPLVADAAVQRSGVMVITGKSFGTTNLLALDEGGEIIREMMIQVRPQSRQVITVLRGVQRETYTCAPNCEQTLAVGDTKEYFDATNTQITTRNSASAGQAPAAAPAPAGR